SECKTILTSTTKNQKDSSLSLLLSLPPNMMKNILPPNVMKNINLSSNVEKNIVDIELPTNGKILGVGILVLSGFWDQDFEYQNFGYQDSG
ncbi:21572_t:CDS:2, partial [Cetraspora pellucida]